MPCSAHRSYSCSLALLTLGLAGCGGDDEAADSSTDVDKLLEETFAAARRSSRAASASRSTSSSDAGDQPLKVSISGPFQSQGEGRLPQLDLDASLEGAGQSLSGGVITTADAGFVSFGDDTYEVAGPVYEQFKAGYEQAAKESSGEQDQSLATLGVDPRRWLTNAQNEGESKVGDTETIKITGDVDVPKLLDDVNGALEKIRSLGVQGSDQIPDKLTDAEKQQTAEAIDELSVEIYTGAEDRILRRIVVTLGIRLPEGRPRPAARRRPTSGSTSSCTTSTRTRTIEAPDNAKPFEELLKQFEGLGLGQLGALGGGARRRRRAAERRRVLRLRAGEPAATTRRSASARTS